MTARIRIDADTVSASRSLRTMQLAIVIDRGETEGDGRIFLSWPVPNAVNPRFGFGARASICSTIWRTRENHRWVFGNCGALMSWVLRQALEQGHQTGPCVHRAVPVAGLELCIEHKAQFADSAHPFGAPQIIRKPPPTPRFRQGWAGQLRRTG